MSKSDQSMAALEHPAAAAINEAVRNLHESGYAVIVRAGGEVEDGDQDYYFALASAQPTQNAAVDISYNEEYEAPGASAGEFSTEISMLKAHRLYACLAERRGYTCTDTDGETFRVIIERV